MYEEFFSSVLLQKSNFPYKSHPPYNQVVSVYGVCARQKINFLTEHGKSSQKASPLFTKECNMQDQTCQLSLFSVETCSLSNSFLQHTLTLQQGENFSVWFSETSHSFNCQHMRIPVSWTEVTGRCCLWVLSTLRAFLHPVNVRDSSFPRERVSAPSQQDLLHFPQWR